MKTTTRTGYRVTLTALVLTLSATAVTAEDKVGGGPRADFRDDTFSIPCVQVDNLAEIHDGRFYDVVLERRGNSFNFELVLAEAEDPGYCQRLADFSLYEDSDFENDGDNDGINGDNFLVSCELRSDSSRITIDARNLDAGQYSATVESDGILAQSQPRQTAADEIGFEFDSNPVAIAKGATPLAADYLETDIAVYAELLNEDTGITVASATALCAVI